MYRFNASQDTAKEFGGFRLESAVSDLRWCTSQITAPQNKHTQ